MIEPEDLIVQFADRIPARNPAAEVLDVACGAGRHALFLARRGCRVVAMDRHLEHLRSLRGAVRKEHLPVDVLESNVESMSLLPECFDAIVNTLFLYRPLFPEYVRALRKGGLLFSGRLQPIMPMFWETRARGETFCSNPASLPGRFPSSMSSTTKNPLQTSVRSPPSWLPGHRL